VEKPRYREVDYYKLTDKGIELRNASAATKMPRTKADQIIVIRWMILSACRKTRILRTEFCVAMRIELRPSLGRSFGSATVREAKKIVREAKQSPTRVRLTETVPTREKRFTRSPYDRRVIPGKPSNPESKVMICSTP
jgi:hypothetical protein